jgi:hypothetical protein
MALTKVTNDLQDALAAAQPTITSVGTLTGLTVSGAINVNGLVTSDDFQIDLSTATTKAEITTPTSLSGFQAFSIKNTHTEGYLSFGTANGQARIQALGANGSADPLNIDVGSSTTAIGIDTSGRVTMPSQPAFSVTKSVNQYNISISNDVLVTWDTESYDVGSNFANNTFTAPVTGKYQLSMLIRINLDSAATYYRTGFDTSNRSYRFIFDPDFGQDATFWSLALSELVDMDANDTAIINLRQVGGSAISDISGSPSYARFTGYLVA